MIPVGSALMSGLSRGSYRWPSSSIAYVSGTNLRGVLGAHLFFRYCLSCVLDHNLSHHAVQRFLPDQLSLRSSPTIQRENVTPLRPQHVPFAW